MVKLVSALFQTNVIISQTNKNTLSEAWNKSEKHRIRQKAKKFSCLSYSTPISQTGISQKGNFWVSGLFQGQKVSGLFCTLRGKWVSGLFWGRISGLFCGLVWLSIVTPLKCISKQELDKNLKIRNWPTSVFWFSLTRKWNSNPSHQLKIMTVSL